MNTFQHFLGIKGLQKELLLKILDTANSFITDDGKAFKSLPLLKDRTIVNLFFEPSTRTRCSFEIAANHLGAHVLNFNRDISSIQKGENLVDTFKNLEAMHLNLFVVRHSIPGTADLLAQHALPNVSIINAGDGCNEHPTQAMLDVLTIMQYKPSLSKLRIAIVGDILHSRVARSQIYALTTLNIAELRVIAPKKLLPTDIDIEKLGVKVYHTLSSGLVDVDVVIVLRMQEERNNNNLLPSKTGFYSEYGITIDRLKIAKPDVIVMHPGPLNRGVEIDSQVADGPHSVILKQTTNGVAVRMAIMSLANN